MTVSSLIAIINESLTFRPRRAGSPMGGALQEDGKKILERRKAVPLPRLSSRHR